MIEFSHVSKCFTIETERARSFQQVLINMWRRSQRKGAETYWALQDVSFQVDSGETLGLIGSNGSGKSTALKLISRIIDPTAGNISVKGRVAALLELGAGFHPDLSGRENVYLNGSILGLSKGYIRQQFDSIVAFAELERFIDTPIRNYSSGMMMRLGFSVATAFQPDILLIDEVLAVGDGAFQSRCLRRIVEIQEAGATVVLITHDLSSVQKLCQRAIWLDKGTMRATGETEDVINRYQESLWTGEQKRQTTEDEKNPAASHDATSAGNAHQGSAPGRRGSHSGRWGSGEVKIERVELLGVNGAPATVFHTGDAFMVRMWYHAAHRVDRPAFGVSIFDEQGNRLNGPNTIWSGEPIAAVEGDGYVDYIVDNLPLLAGRYDLTVAIYDRHITQPYDHWHRGFSFTVVPGETERQDGALYIPCHWRHDGAAASDAHIPVVAGRSV
jgi:ABC-type polysaccharide/polyol phosphate transport system ATPase subunit